MEQSQQLAQAVSDFQTLHSLHSLPPLMDYKLRLLLSALQNTPLPQDLLPLHERHSLEEMPRQAQAELFCSIVRCLSGREVLTYFAGERCYVRREGSLFAWGKCYLGCDSRALTLRRGREGAVWLRMELERVWISKTHKDYKKKRVFSLYYVDTKYVLGFDLEITCARVHATLGQLLAERREFQTLRFEQMQPQPVERLGLEGREVEQMMRGEERQFLESVQARVEAVGFGEEGEFKLVRNLEQGRVLQRADGCVKVSLLVERVGALELAEMYADFKWNSRVESCSFDSRPRANSYTATLRTTRYSLLSYPREARLSVIYYRPCSCRSSSPSYLLLESMQAEGQAVGAVRMGLKQGVEFASRKEERQLVLMTVVTQADFRGYASSTDNSQMLMHLLEDLKGFSTYCQREKERESRPRLFQELECACNVKKREVRKNSAAFSDVSLPTEQFGDNFSEAESRMSSRQTSAIDADSAERYVLKVLQDIENDIPNQAIFDILKTNKHCSYSLKHRFAGVQSFGGRGAGVGLGGRDFLLQGGRWKFEGDEYVFCDAVVLAAQKDILKMIIKQLSSNLLAGKSVMTMSLPVEIFDRRSMLDLIANSLGFLPHFLGKAAKASDGLEQMKLVVAAFMFVSATAPNIEKPFNPILGETFQGTIGGVPIVLEQISHHPPVSAVFIRTAQYEVTGNFDVTVDMGFNSAYSKTESWLRVRLLGSQREYLVKMPDVELGGLMYGSRTLRIANKGFVLERAANLFCEYSIGSEKKRVYESSQKVRKADLAGGIFRIRNELTARIAGEKRKGFEGLKVEDVMETCCFLSGKWYGELKFDGVVYKSVAEGPFPQRAQRQRYLLPSDSIFREDVIYKRWGKNDQSNQEKERLENLQRNDRKLREKFRKTH